MNSASSVCSPTEYWRRLFNSLSRPLLAKASSRQERKSILSLVASVAEPYEIGHGFQATVVTLKCRTEGYVSLYIGGDRSRSDNMPTPIAYNPLHGRWDGQLSQ